MKPNGRFRWWAARGVEGLVALASLGIVASGLAPRQAGKLWRTAGRLLGVITERPPPFVESVAFSPDGKTLASAGYDLTVHPDDASAQSVPIIKLWDVATGKEFDSLKGGDRAVRCLAFSPDGKTLAAGEKGIRLWDLTTGKEVAAWAAAASASRD